MFSVSTKGLYGAQALIEMAVRKDEGVLQIKDLSEKCGIPKTYLEQLFNRLRKAGIISSLRGNKGGYILAKEASEISLLEIMEALEGEVEISKNIDFNGALKTVFDDTENSIKNCFTVSLAELAEREIQLKENVTFYI